MYNLNINFLKDRKLDTTQTQTSGSFTTRKQATPINERVPIIAGVTVGVALVVASSAALMVINRQKAKTEAQIRDLETKISRLKGQNEEVQQLQAQIAQVKQDTKALVSVFKQIKPWSALLEEISELIPPTVQVRSIRQSGQNNTTTLDFTGVASSYDDVNDFVLTLKKSRFINSQNTRLNNSRLQEINSINEPLSDSGQSSGQEERASVNLAEIEFSITAELSDIPASELVNDLKRRGAIGLVNRLRNLESKGAIQP